MAKRSISGTASSTRSGPKFSNRLVTPDLAKKWLDANTHNRALRAPLLRSYAADMAAGKWRLNGETIKFDDTGRLLDGQHRLAAIIEADVPIRLMIVSGLEPEDQETIDTGARRSLSDTLRLRKEPYATNIASLLRRLWLYKRGEYDPASSNLRPSTAQLLAVLDGDMGNSIREAARIGMGLYQAIRVSSTTFAFTYWVCNNIDPTDAEYFFTRLRTGEAVRGEPTHTLRNQLLDRAHRKVKGQEKKNAALIFKAWNAYRDGRRLATLSWNGGGATPEPFPTPR